VWLIGIDVSEESSVFIISLNPERKSMYQRREKSGKEEDKEIEKRERD
jgi:hypothetical protein